MSTSLLYHAFRISNVEYRSTRYVGNRRYTRSFALTVLDLLQFAAIRAVADYLNVGWDMIKEIHKIKLSRIYKKQGLSNLTYLGFDDGSVCSKSRANCRITSWLSPVPAISSCSSAVLVPYVAAKNMKGEMKRLLKPTFGSV